MTLNKLHQDLGAVQGELKGLREDVSEMRVQLTSACAYIERQKGARKATIALATAFSSAAALIISTAVAWYTK